ncbi:BMP family ABC transporter substrate-binding protein [Planctomycetales bacterium]|nr:BMP family ABC transporter substrate-binding protein [Planctomycetales bacterium]GHS97720.1 BMP family ABC transporter substrate-binding protein [Planctomycetales bacterium]GHT03427.1 BMP family ABC transporter substrate-binding protein [Planctomycetales bacterium]
MTNPRILLLFAVAALTLAGCGDDSAAPPAAAAWTVGAPIPAERIKIGVVYISDPKQEKSGYSREHYVGIAAMQKTLHLRDDQILTRTDVSDAEPRIVEFALRELITLGANVIFATSFNYMDVCEQLAAEFPNVIFAHCSGYKFNERNFTNYFGRIYQAWYLSGIVAGLSTQTGKIGYVVAFGAENSECSGCLNAFALGAASVNPQAQIWTRVVNNWFDPPTEALAANELLSAGCDIIVQHTDSPRSLLEAQKAGARGLGYNSNMRVEAPDAVLASAVWNWGAYYTACVRSVIDGSFTTRPYFGGIAEGLLDLTPLNETLVTPDLATVIKQKVDAARAAMRHGQFNVFDGEIKTNDGKIIGAAGKTLSDADIRQNIHWYGENVRELP